METNTENAAPEGISTTYFNCAKCEEDEIDAHWLHFEPNELELISERCLKLVFAGVKCLFYDDELQENTHLLIEHTASIYFFCSGTCWMQNSKKIRNNVLFFRKNWIGFNFWKKDEEENFKLLGRCFYELVGNWN